MNNTTFDLQGKTALVTGSTGGLGSVFAEGLAIHGAHVVLHGRNLAKCKSLAAELSEKGYEVSFTVFDITDHKSISGAASEIIAGKGAPDILVNNAGINLRHPLEEFPEEDWDKVMDANLKAAYLVSKAFAKEMIARNSGKIINICSLQSELGRKSISPYAASKGGLKMLTRGMATEWAEHNIQVNGIAPGYFKTEMTRPLYEDAEFDSWLKNRTPANRWGDPEELVGALVFLASRASDFVNGQLIFVDGGITASV